MIFWQLLLSFAQIGLLSFGGGYASMALIQRQAVDLHAWLTMEQFADIMAIAEMTPGPIAVNAATFVGIRVAGIPGALVATLGCVAPTCAVALLLALLYERYHDLSVMQGALSGLRPAVVAMIASAGLSLLSMALYGERSFPTRLAALLDADLVSLAIFAAALVCLAVFKWPPIRVMLAAAAAGVVLGLLFGGTASAEPARGSAAGAGPACCARRIERAEASLPPDRNGSRAAFGELLARFSQP